MTIVLDGNLGITTPSETNTGTLSVTGATNLAVSSGNVGIGTASPASKLDVVTNGSTVAGSFTGNGLEVKHPTLPSNFFAGTQTGSDVKLASVGAYPMLFYTNSTQQAGITAAGLFQFNSGYGSAATAYGCRAWVNFNGTGTVAIRGSGNVSSITDNGTGDYTVNFTTAMPDANYNPLLTLGGTNAVYVALSGTTNNVAQTVSAYRWGITVAAGGVIDVINNCVAIFR